MTFNIDVIKEWIMKQYTDIMDTYRTPRTEGYQENGVNFRRSVRTPATWRLWVIARSSDSIVRVNKTSPVRWNDEVFRPLVYEWQDEVPSSTLWSPTQNQLEILNRTSESLVVDYKQPTSKTGSRLPSWEIIPSRGNNSSHIERPDMTGPKESGLPFIMNKGGNSTMYLSRDISKLRFGRQNQSGGRQVVM